MSHKYICDLLLPQVGGFESKAHGAWFQVCSGQLVMDSQERGPRPGVAPWERVALPLDPAREHL